MMSHNTTNNLTSFTLSSLPSFTLDILKTNEHNTTSQQTEKKTESIPPLPPNCSVLNCCILEKVSGNQKNTGIFLKTMQVY